jgi:hypothetical protein
MNPELKSVLEGYLLNAFTWMIEDGIAQDVEAEVNLLANYKIQGIITITKNDGTQIPPQYFDLWEFTSVN